MQFIGYDSIQTFNRCVHLKLQLNDAIHRIRFYSNSLIHILSLSNLHNNVASIQMSLGPIYPNYNIWFFY